MNYSIGLLNGLGFCIAQLMTQFPLFLFFSFSFLYAEWVNFLSSLGWPIRVSPLSNPKVAWVLEPYPNFQPVNSENITLDPK
jgi:hypothetical protein